MKKRLDNFILSSLLNDLINKESFSGKSTPISISWDKENRIIGMYSLNNKCVILNLKENIIYGDDCLEISGIEKMNDEISSIFSKEEKEIFDILVRYSILYFKTDFDGSSNFCVSLYLFSPFDNKDGTSVITEGDKFSVFIEEDLDFLTSDMFLKASSSVSNKINFFHIVKNLYSIDKSRKIKTTDIYNFIVSSIELNEDFINTIKNKCSDSSGPIPRINEIVFLDCSLDISTSEIRNLFEKGTKVIFQNCS